MSVIREIYNAFVGHVAPLLTDYTKVADPYDIERNAALKLRKGWGVSILPGSDGNRSAGGEIFYRRNITLTLAQQIFSTENDENRRELQRIEMLEKHEDILKRFKSGDLDGRIKPEFSDEGIIITEAERKYYILPINFVIEYRIPLEN